MYGHVFLQEANYCIFQQVNNVKSNQKANQAAKPRRSRLLKEIKNFAINNDTKKWAEKNLNKSSFLHVKLLLPGTMDNNYNSIQTCRNERAQYK